MASTTSSLRHQRSHSPSGRFCASSISTSTSFSSASPSYSPPAAVLHRSSSPTRVNMYAASSPSPSHSVRFSVDKGQIYAVNRNRNPFPAGRKKVTCLCSPTAHPGSFRCSFHRNLELKQKQQPAYSPNRLNMRRSAMTNSLVRIGTVEGGEWVIRALATLIRPCAHQQRRRDDFRPRPSRLCITSKASDDEI